jgi:hypothetical protein
MLQVMTVLSQCDEVSPECSQCIQSSIRCPGAVVGNVFIDMSNDVEERYRKSTRRNRKVPDTTSVQRSNILQAATSSDSERFGALSKDAPQYRMLSQPFSVSALKEQLVGNFIHSLLGSPGGPLIKRWMLGLPDVMLHEHLLTVRYAMYAASMALYSRFEEDVALQREACKWYIMGLKSEQKSLGSRTVITDGALCAPMLLSFYEMIGSASADNWMNHISAAATLLQLRGVESFDTDFAHTLFCAIRLAMVSLQLPPTYIGICYKSIPDTCRYTLAPPIGNQAFWLLMPGLLVLSPNILSLKLTNSLISLQ